MGLKPITEADWLQPGDQYKLRIEQKRKLLCHDRSRVLRRSCETSTLEYECMHTIIDNLSDYHRHHAVTKSDCFQRARSMTAKDASKQSSLAVLTELIEEDICLLEEQGGELVLVAGSVCTPSWWSLRNKIGKPILQIHAPVPGLQDKIGSMITHFLHHLKAGKVYQRANWAIWPTAQLCLFPDSMDVEASFARIADDEVGENLYLRVERQTLRRLPDSGAIVFTIKVYVSPLNALVERVGAADDLLRAIDSLDANERSYRRTALYEKKVKQYLCRISAA